MGPATNSRLGKRLSLSLSPFVIKLFRANPLFLFTTFAKCKGKKFHRSLNPTGSDIRKAAGKNWRKKWLGLLVSWYAVGGKDDCLLIKFGWTPCPHHTLCYLPIAPNIHSYHLSLYAVFCLVYDFLISCFFCCLLLCMLLSSTLPWPYFSMCLLALLVGNGLFTHIWPLGSSIKLQFCS